MKKTTDTESRNLEMQKPAAEPREFRPGIAYRDNKLYLFDKKGVTVCRGWPNPMAWTKTKKKPTWRHCRSGKFGILSAGGLLTAEEGATWELTDTSSQMWLPLTWSTKAGAFDYEEMKFWALIPNVVQRAVAQYPARHWHMFQFCARVPGAIRLIRSNPMLAFCLANNWVFHKPAVKRPLRAARALIRKRQRESLGWLGFPATEPVAKLSRKIDPSAVSIINCLNLRGAVHDASTLRLLAHLPVINDEIVQLVTHRRLRPLVTPELLADIAAEFLQWRRDESEMDCTLYNQLLRDQTWFDRWDGTVPYGVNLLAAIFQYPLPPPPPQPHTRGIYDLIRMMERTHPDGIDGLRIRSLRELDNLHQEAVEEFNRVGLERMLQLTFPKPPLPGMNTAEIDIRPVATAAELAKHGRAQHNCVAGYAEQIADGTYYVYALKLGSETCTCGLRRVGGNQWALAEISAAGNQPASQFAIQQVGEWLAKTQSVRPPAFAYAA